MSMGNYEIKLIINNFAEHFWNMVHERVLRKTFAVLFKLFSFYCTCWHDVYVKIHFLATKDE